MLYKLFYEQVTTCTYFNFAQIPVKPGLNSLKTVIPPPQSPPTPPGNSMHCDTRKCKELLLHKKGGNLTFYPLLHNIKQYSSSISILGVKVQRNCKFSLHVKAKLHEAKKKFSYKYKSSQGRVHTR